MTSQALRTIAWVDGAIELLDQTLLPQQTETLHISTIDDLVDAIKRLSVRGAPALGVAGAYGVALAAQLHDPQTDADQFDAAVERIRTARPTAVNLAVMVDRVAPIARRSVADALAEATKVEAEEVAASTAMGELGADLAQELCGDAPLRVMTICNTGGLAAVVRGTALAVIQTLHERGKLTEAIPLETRPLLQGGRLTTWELEQFGAPYRLIVDSAAAMLLARGAADLVVIGADRVAANGDTANKIGSFSLALGAANAGVPFVVVAPESTVDMHSAHGDDIDIEDRGPDEVGKIRGIPVAPDGAPAMNPAFDVTPVQHITALVTDTRVVRFDQGETLESHTIESPSREPK